MNARIDIEPGRPDASATSRVVLGGALAGAAAVLCVWLCVALRTDGPVDFSVYYLAGWFSGHGRDVYLVTREQWQAAAAQVDITHLTWPYRYSPHLAALMSLLAPLGPDRAMTAWGVASVAALVAGAAVVGSALGGGWRILLSLASLVAFGPVYHTLYDGQVNGFVFLALAVAFRGLARDRSLAAGAGVAVAAALKLTPLALVAYLAWRRRWKAFLVSLAVLAVLTVATLPVTGPGVYLTYLHRAYPLTDPAHVNPSGANQSATATLARLVLLSASKVPAEGVTAGVRSAAQVFGAALFVLTALATWPRRGPASPPAPGATLAAARATGGRSSESSLRDDDLLGFGAVVAATLVVGPFTWYHQFVLLLIPLLTLACRWVSARRWGLVAVLAVLIVAIDANELLWTRLHGVVIESGGYRALSMPFVAALVVWAAAAGALVVSRWRSLAGQSATRRERRGRRRGLPV